MAILGIIGAMESEVILLRDAMTHMTEVEWAGGTFYEGNLYDLPVILARSGVGKINAAICAQIMCTRFDIQYLINVGVAGGLKPGMQVGDVVISTALMHHDIDPHIFALTETVNKAQGDERWPGFFRADSWLVDRSTIACQKLQGEFSFREVSAGYIASGDWFINDAAKKQAIRDNFQALCVEMEGAAIGQVATANHVPFVVIRAISDMADEEAADTFLSFVEITAQKAAKVIQAVVEDIVLLL